jgi:hypothetical protein
VCCKIRERPHRVINNDERTRHVVNIFRNQRTTCSPRKGVWHEIVTVPVSANCNEQTSFNVGSRVEMNAVDQHVITDKATSDC